MNPHCTRKVIGGELQERLIPVPYSKTSTDQAVRFETSLLFHSHLVCLDYSLCYVFVFVFFYVSYCTLYLQLFI